MGLNSHASNKYVIYKRLILIFSLMKADKRIIHDNISIHDMKLISNDSRGVQRRRRLLMGSNPHWFDQI